jgi:DNA-binding NarL/FixJ family response regulator
MLRDTLTPRQLEVAACLARGLSNRQVANELVIEEGTVKNHVHHILMALGLRTRTELALLAAHEHARSEVVSNGT